MSYAIKDIEAAANFFGLGEHTWDWFVDFIRKGPLQLQGYVGVAELVEEYGDVFDDDKYVIFKVSQGRDVERFFRLTTPSSSFGDTYNAYLNEVKPIEVKAVSWEAV